MKKIALLLLFYTIPLLAITPFSLENVKSVNFIILDKKKTLSKELKKQIELEMRKKLKEAGIKTKSNSFSNLLLKIKKEKIASHSVYHVKLFLTEDIVVQRTEKIKAIAITYQKEDFFKTDLGEEDLIESIEFLADEFLSQHEEENDL